MSVSGAPSSPPYRHRSEPTGIEDGGELIGVVSDIPWTQLESPIAGSGRACYVGSGAPPSPGTQTITTSDLVDCRGRLVQEDLTWPFPGTTPDRTRTAFSGAPTRAEFSHSVCQVRLGAAGATPSRLPVVHMTGSAQCLSSCGPTRWDRSIRPMRRGQRAARAPQKQKSTPVARTTHGAVIPICEGLDAPLLVKDRGGAVRMRGLASKVLH